MSDPKHPFDLANIKGSTAVQREAGPADPATLVAPAPFDEKNAPLIDAEIIKRLKGCEKSLVDVYKSEASHFTACIKGKMMLRIERKF